MTEQLLDSDRSIANSLPGNDLLIGSIQALPHPFYIINADDYTVSIANPAAGPYTPGETTCHHMIHRLLSPCNGDHFPCPIREIKKTGMPVHFRHHHVDSKGDLQYVDVHAFPIFDGEHNLSHVVEYALDAKETGEVEHALRERIKELTCLYAVNRDMHQSLSVEEFCWRVVEHLVRAMQFPEKTAAAIELLGKKYASSEFSDDLSHGYQKNIEIRGQIRGCIKVYYLDTEPNLIPEEEDLVDGIAKTLSVGLERTRIEEALRASEASFRELFEHTAQPVFVIDVTDDDNYRIENRNNAYERATGLPGNGSMGTLVEEVLQPDMARKLVEN